MERGRAGEDFREEFQPRSEMLVEQGGMSVKARVLFSGNIFACGAGWTARRNAGSLTACRHAEKKGAGNRAAACVEIRAKVLPLGGRRFVGADSPWGLAGQEFE